MSLAPEDVPAVIVHVAALDALWLTTANPWQASADPRSMSKRVDAAVGVEHPLPDDASDYKRKRHREQENGAEDGFAFDFLVEQDG